MTARAIIAVCGLTREARALAGAQITAITGGGDSAGLEAALEAACVGARGLISIGLGGALAEGLGPGDWVVARGVMMQQGRVATDADWTERLVGRLPGAKAGDVVGSDAVVVSAMAKRALHASSGALAVDMESHVVARVAARRGLPFAVARVISDGADRALPLAAQAGMKRDGGMDVMAVLVALMRRPAELPALIRTGMEAETAFGALLRGRQLLGPALGGPGGPDLGELLVDVG